VGLKQNVKLVYNFYCSPLENLEFNGQGAEPGHSFFAYTIKKKFEDALEWGLNPQTTSSEYASAMNH